MALIFLKSRCFDAKRVVAGRKLDQRVLAALGCAAPPAPLLILILKEDLGEFSKAMSYVVTESTRLHNTGVSVDVALKQANWGAYDTWTSKDRNAAIALQRVYDELDGKLK